MITAAQLIKKYGDPRGGLKWEVNNMTSYDVPLKLELINPAIPKRIYCHRDFASTLDAWLHDMAKSSLIHEIKTWDGCFNVRGIGAYRKKKVTEIPAEKLSLHSWGFAIDVNAAHNPDGYTREENKARGLEPFSDQFIALARKYVTCGYDFKGKEVDGQHFQAKELLP